MNTNRFDRAMIVVDIVVATLTLLTYICEGVPFGVFSPLFFCADCPQTMVRIFELSS